MKPITSTITEVDNMPGEEIEFTISAADAGLIMKSLADLYSNRTKATIREYSTNARDSHIEAGNDAPVEITLPNVMHPFFTVQDFGTGMSAKELKETYTQFGRSTKRESDDYNGLLGYGSKSALAYTNSFTITAVKDGMKAVGVVTRKDSGAMVLKEVLNVQTLEPNGVTIQVPVHNIDEFNRTAREFYRFWPTGSVSLNGEVHKNEFDDPDKLLDAASNMYNNSVDGACYVVMGNVAYPVNNPESLFPTNDAYIPFVAYVDNGTVEFTPSREALNYTDYTRAALQNIVDSYIKNVRATAEAEVAQATTKWDALAASRKWFKILGNRIQYQNEDIPTKIDFRGKVWRVGRHWNPVENAYNIDLDGNVMVIVDATETISTYTRNRLSEWWLNHNPLNVRPNYVYFTRDSQWVNEWVNPAYVVSWETVKAQTPPSPKTGRVKAVKGSWDIVKQDGTQLAEQTITKEKYWVEHTFHRNTPLRDWKDIFTTFTVDASDIVLVPANRVEKFKRDYPTIKNLRDAMKSQVDLDGDAMYTREERAHFSLNWYHKQALSRLDESRVVDPDLAMLVKASRGTYQQPANYELNLRRANMLHLPFKRFKPNHEYEKVLARYPLVNFSHQGWATVHNDHVYLYINACVQARKDGVNV